MPATALHIPSRRQEFLSGAGSTFEVDLDEAPIVSRATKATSLSAWPGLLTAVALVGSPVD